MTADTAQYPDSRFWNRLAAKYAQKPVRNPDAYQYKLDKTQQYLKPEMSVLEIGCGTGTTALKHASHVKYIRAIDFSCKMLEIARAKAKEKNIQNVSFENISINDINQNDGPYDAIMAHSILHLIADKDACLAKIAALLNHGGIFVSSTVCVADSFPLLGMVAPVGKLLGILPIINSFSQTNLISAIENTGFTINHTWKPDGGRAVFIVAIKNDADAQTHTNNSE